MKKWKEIIVILIISLIAFLIRSYKGINSFPFTGEFGDNLLDIKNAISENKIPLFGPPTSHPWLLFGPLYYWIMIPIMTIFKFNPLAGYWFGILSGSLVILLNYLVIKKVINEKVALISSLLICISPLYISFSKDARFFFLVTLVFYGLIYSLHIFLKEKKNIFWVGFFMSLFFHFHYSPILLFPSLFIFLYMNKEKVFKQIKYLITGFIIPFIPILIEDSKNKFTMFKNLFLWVPYRIAGFLGLYPKNNISLQNLSQSLNSTIEFIGKSFIYEKNFWSLSFYIFSVFLILYLVKYFKTNKKNPIVLFLFYSLIISIIGVFIHGDTPVHYYLPVFPIPLIIVSIFIDDCFKNCNSFTKGVFFGLLILIIVLNTKYFIKFYFQFDDNYFSNDSHYVSYNLQYQVAQYIIEDSKGNKFSLIRTGPYDYFEENYSQNYKYLLWYMGSEPIKNSSLIYEIVEGRELFVNYKKYNLKLINDNIGVVRYEK